MTFERSPVSVDVQPDQFGHVWTAPAKPSYTVTLRNHSAAARSVELEFTTVSHDSKEKTNQKQTVSVPPGNADTPVKFAINDLKKYGYHTVVLTMKDGTQVWTENRSLAFLHLETREKGGYEDGRGPLLGFWGWGGGHDTPSSVNDFTLMAQAGAETCLGSLDKATPDVKAIAEKKRIHHLFLVRWRCDLQHRLLLPPLSEKYDPKNPDASAAALLEVLRKSESKPSALCKPSEVPFFPEPGIGAISFGNYPDYYGEPEYKLSPDEDKAFQVQLTKFLIGAKAVRANWPQAKILLPHGDPLYVVPFLRYSPEARALIDGTALDMPGFERMPEMQLHQVCHHRLYELVNEYHKAGKANRTLP